MPYPDAFPAPLPVICKYTNKCRIFAISRKASVKGFSKIALESVFLTKDMYFCMLRIIIGLRYDVGRNAWWLLEGL